MKKKIATFSQYTCISFFALLINLCIVWYATERLYMHYLVSCTLGFIVAQIIAFGMNRQWTFHSSVSVVG